jgi:hypothetical protein
MIPHDIEPTVWKLPPGERNSAVLITGSDSPRYQRLAVRLQQEFPGLLKLWLSSARSSRSAENSWKKLRNNLSQFKKPESLLLGDVKKIEANLFRDELKRLEPSARLSPVYAEDMNSDSTADMIREVNPYFLFVLGGPLLKKSIIEIAPVGINQHAGWSPEYKGSFTTHQALYQHRLDFVGSTVHLITTAADAGAILRRAPITLTEDESPAQVFMNVVALGNELLIDSVRDIQAADESINIFEQPRSGMTYRMSQLDRNVRISLSMDRLTGWRKRAIRSGWKY